MTTPMRSQYLAIKKQYPDIILLFRLGDFYETFDDDARIVSSVCDVVLTSRPVARTSACRWRACRITRSTATSPS